MPVEPELAVMLHGQHAGTLQRDGSAVFLAYTHQYLADQRRVPLSLSLPLSLPAQDPDGLQPTRWLDGLLPGNLKVRDRWAALYKADSSSPFDLLATRVGHDCAGAIQFCAPGKMDDLSNRSSGVRWLTDEEFETEIMHVVNDPDSWGASSDSEGFSLAGAYPKICLTAGPDGRWGRPYGNAPSTHILKPARLEQMSLPVNEFLALRTAMHAGVSASQAELHFVGDYPLLVVSRFDRTQAQGGGVARVHQEDMLQAAGGGRHLYQSRGGLSPSEIAWILRRHASTPMREQETFLSQLAYRWLVRDPDGHSKNYAVMLAPGDVTMAPLYDTWSVNVMAPHQSHENQRQAMWPHDGMEIADLDPDAYWRAMSQVLGLRPRHAIQTVNNIAERFSEAAQQAVSELPDHPSASEPAQHFLALAGQRRRFPTVWQGASRRGRANNPGSSANRRSRMAVEPPPRCGAWMPVSKTRCVLPDKHNGPHRSSTNRRPGR